MQDVIGVDAVDHIDIMSRVAQLMGEAIQIDGVASESVRRVE